MKTRIFAALTTAVLIAAAPVLAGETTSPTGAMVYFGNLSDGDSVSGPVKVIFGLTGMGVAPAGTEKENTGHHHILLNRAALGEVDGDEDIIAYGIPGDENHIHFGGGQTETTLDLPTGTHTLQMVLGDLNHVPHDPIVASGVITITVE